MAYANLVTLARIIDIILNSHQGSISPQLKNQIISIDKYVIFLQAFLHDFPKKATGLEGRIREVTHVAANNIEFVSEIIHRSSVGPSNSKGVYANPNYISQELKKVSREMKSIVKQVMEIKDSINTVKNVVLSDSPAASSSSGVAPAYKDAMVGFEDDLMEMKCRLCGESSNLEVIPIVGMGGIGKTTLARNAYDDPLIIEHFYIRVWVTVSQDYNIRDIASSLLVSIKLPDPLNETIEELKVYKKLKGRRYLIVLDDVWSIKAWDDLKMLFPNDGKGSRIMLTTRLSDVASYTGSNSPLHEMKLMDEDQSWDLLRHKVFKQDPCPTELEYIGMMIARSCRGLPLAVVVVSGLLTIDQSKAAWESIAEDVKSAISANDEQLDEILSLSYTRMPHHLRPCFLYLGGFPEDYEMRVSILIKLWVAEGFLKPNGCKNFEEIAEEYLEDLVRRSLVLVTKKTSNGRIKNISIHDLMRDMCKRKAEQENFLSHVCEFPLNCMRIPRCVSVFHSAGLNYHRETILRGKYSFLSYSEHPRLTRILDWVEVHDEMLRGHIKRTPNFVPQISIPSLPVEMFELLPSLTVEVFELFYLRYLAFDCPVRIPAAISKFENLQSLIFFGSKKWFVEPFIVSLPLEIWTMTQLRHLVLFRGFLPFQEGAPVTLGNLQTLSGAINFICYQEILKRIPNLKKLGIYYPVWRDDVDYQLHNLIYLQHLECLKLKIENYGKLGKGFKPVFPRTLKKLYLHGLQLPWRDMEIVGSLPNLEVLKLRHLACVGTTWETTEGGFCHLKFLLMERTVLKFWITESSHFPNLRCLVLGYCSLLSEIPDDIGEIPTLELIVVSSSDESLVKSAKRIQDVQQSCGNDTPQVHYHWRFQDTISDADIISDDDSSDDDSCQRPAPDDDSNIKG